MGYVLILLFTCGGTLVPAAFLFDSALVVEKVLEAASCTAAVIGPLLVLLFVTVSLQNRLIAGRVEACEIGILKTFARDASTGERGRIMHMYLDELNWGIYWRVGECSNLGCSGEGPLETASERKNSRAGVWYG